MSLNILTGLSGAPDTGRCGDSAFNGPRLARPTEAASQKILGHPCFSGKFCERKIHPSVKEANVRAPVVGLLTLRGPAHVAWLIVAVVVGPSIKRKFGAWPFSHIEQEVAEVPPAAAHRDAPSLIVSEGRIGGLSASGDHVLPSRIGRRSLALRMLMPAGATLWKWLALIAPRHTSLPKGWTAHSSLISANATCPPSSVRPLVFHSTNDGPIAKAMAC